MAWTGFLKEVKEARKALKFKDDEECFFRGHAYSSWELHPTLLRHCLENGLKSDDEIRDLESALFFEFRSRAKELHGQSLSDWDILFHMRHHTLATRLLDWTEGLGVAVYFALQKATENSTPCVWLLNPYALNKKKKSWKVRDLVAPEYLPHGDYEFGDYLVDYSKSKGFDWDWPVALYPMHRNARLHAQHGYFTIHGEDTRPLELIAPDVVRKVPLPREARDEAWEFLRIAGINEYLLFPDLDHLASHLHRKYGIR